MELDSVKTIKALKSSITATMGSSQYRFLILANSQNSNISDCLGMLISLISFYKSFNWLSGFRPGHPVR